MLHALVNAVAISVAAFVIDAELATSSFARDGLIRRRTSLLALVIHDHRISPTTAWLCAVSRAVDHSDRNYDNGVLCDDC